MFTLYIVTCHLPRVSKLRWREDIGGKLPSAQGSRIAYYTDYTFTKKNTTVEQWWVATLCSEMLANSHLRERVVII